MTGVFNVSTDCCCQVSRDDRLAARVFGGIGRAGLSGLAALAEACSSPRGLHAQADSDPGRSRRLIHAVPPEVSLGEALSDPIVRAVMAADRVDPAELEESLDALAKKLARPRAGGR